MSKNMNKRTVYSKEKANKPSAIHLISSGLKKHQDKIRKEIKKVNMK